MKRRLRCLLVDLGWRLIPVAGFRSWLLRNHLDGCPDCRAGLADKQEIRELFPGPEARIVAGLIALAAGAGGEPAERSAICSAGYRKSWLVRLYAGVTAAAIVILLVGFGWYLGRQVKPGQNLHGDDTNEAKIVSKVSLGYVRFNDQPADTYLYRTDDPEMVIIWVESSN